MSNYTPRAQVILAVIITVLIFTAIFGAANLVVAFFVIVGCVIVGGIVLVYGYVGPEIPQKKGLSEEEQARDAVMGNQDLWY